MFIAVFLVIVTEIAEAAPPSVTTAKPPTHAAGGSADLVAVSREMAQQQQGIVGDDRSSVQSNVFEM